MMNIANSFLSHPNKRYNDHIERISDSFEDKNHKICALYHDLGKLSKEFQNYISLKQEQNETNEGFEKRRAKLKTTHALESSYLYFSNTLERDSNFLANFFTILKHHSSLDDISEKIRSYLAVIDSHMEEDRFSKIKDIAEKSDVSFEKDIYEFVDFFDELDEDKKFYTQDNFFLFKETYSKLILADKFEAIFDKPYKNVDFLTQEEIKSYLTKLQTLINTKKPNPYRTKVRETVLNNFSKRQNQNLFIIKAPTGAGKTFISLELALNIAKIKSKRRVITALPFTSIIDQTHGEYEQIVPKVLKYHHLTKYKEGVDEDEKEQFNQKVFLADIWHENFIVTTFNQLLYTFFSNHNRDNLKLESLRDSVIIIDEIQNIHRGLLKDISFVLEEFAKKYNIDFIIMSATMPQISDYLSDFQLLSEDFFYQEKKSRYSVKYDNSIDTLEDLATIINKYNNQSILCVVNTIAKAKELYTQIEGEKFLLTTHQIPMHRKEIIETIKQKLQKNQQIILISTQLIEAGVDLDFDIGFREFAPFSSIIQIAGRVNREGRKKDAKVIVCNFLNKQKFPYHDIDLQEKSIKELLTNEIKENDILDKIDNYFDEVKNKTNSVELIQNIKNLEFQTLFRKFNDNFMPKQPWKVSLFIEQKPNHFQRYIENRKDILDNSKDKFEAINKIKELEKELGLYTISVNEQLLAKLTDNPKYLFGRYILTYGSPHYKKKDGFTLELTLEEEIYLTKVKSQ